MTDTLHFEQDNLGIVTLTMDYPPTRNALTGSGLVDAFLAAFQAIAHKTPQHADAVAAFMATKRDKKA